MKKIIGVSVAFCFFSLGVLFLKADFTGLTAGGNNSVLTQSKWNDLVNAVSRQVASTDASTFTTFDLNCSRRIVINILSVPKERVLYPSYLDTNAFVTYTNTSYRQYYGSTANIDYNGSTDPDYDSPILRIEKKCS